MVTIPLSSISFKGNLIKKFALCISLIVSASPILIRGMEMDRDTEFLKGIQGKERVNVALLGVSYQLLPSTLNRMSLARTSMGCLQLVQNHEQGNQINGQSLFYFENIEGTPFHFTLKQRNKNGRDYNICDRERNKNQCVIEIGKGKEFKLKFKDHTQDCRPSFLQYDATLTNPQNTIFANLQKHSFFWILQPAYDFTPLHPKEVEKETLLFKISRREKITNTLLSSQQIKDLYNLHYRFDAEEDRIKKNINILHEEEDCFFASTEELFYTQGFFIQGTAFAVTVKNMAGCSWGIGEDFQKAKENISHNPAHQETTLDPGQTLFLIPNYGQGMPLLGKIELTPKFVSNSNNLENNLNKVTGLFHLRGDNSVDIKKSYTSSGYSFSLREIMTGVMEGRTSKLFPTFAYEFSDNCLRFLETNKSILTEPGTAAYAINMVLENNLQNLETILLKGFSTPLIKASANLENGMLRASENLSEAMKESVKDLGDAIQKASLNCSDSVKLLSQSTLNISKDIKEDVKTISRSLVLSVKLFEQAISGASANVSASLMQSSRFFKEALHYILQASEKLENGLQGGPITLAEAMEKASNKFKEGMGQLSWAMQNMNVNAEVDVGIGCCVS